MAKYPLSERLQSVRDLLTYSDLRSLAQEVLDEVTPLVYAQGIQDGKVQLLQSQRDERERRKVARGRKEWITAVYFIRSAQAIKIGLAKNPTRRLTVLQTSHHDSLALAAQCPGGRELEGSYHRAFAAHRLQGEWFRPHPDILAEIDRLNEHGAQTND